MERMTLELVDQEAVMANDGRTPGGLTRLQLLRRAALTGGAVIGGGLLVTGVPKAYAATGNDTNILNLLLLNESLEAAFYAKAAAAGTLSGRLQEFAEQVAKNEAVHRDTVAGALGDAATKVPEFEFPNAKFKPENVQGVALVLENNDVFVNNGAGPVLDSKDILAVAGQIVSVESRQAAWIRRIAYGPDYAARRFLPAPTAFDLGLPLPKLGPSVDENVNTATRA